MSNAEAIEAGWADIDPDKDYALKDPVTEKGNPFGKELILRADLVYRVTQFGYTPEGILEAIIKNATDH